MRFFFIDNFFLVTKKREIKKKGGREEETSHLLSGVFFFLSFFLSSLYFYRGIPRSLLFIFISHHLPHNPLTCIPFCLFYISCILPPTPFLLFLSNFQIFFFRRGNYLPLPFVVDTTYFHHQPSF